MFNMRLPLLLLPLFWPSTWGVEVKNLPGLKEHLNFRHYSGYLTASPTHRLHYWFTESQGNPDSDPVILWLNGGPGCSSLFGLLTELGPFHIRRDGKTLYLNPYSWNKVANVLFLESPAGVGFSYSTDGNITTGDSQTAEENYVALRDFYSQFEQFRNNSLYLAGESYGGMYVPTLAARIIDGARDFPVNIRGLAVGNGLLSMSLMNITYPIFAYSHGFVDESDWRQIVKDCCHGCADNCNFGKAAATSKFCREKIRSMSGVKGLNIFDIYADCNQPFTGNLTTFPADFLMQGVHCLNYTSLAAYLNQEKVRSALAIPEHVGNWTVYVLIRHFIPPDYGYPSTPIRKYRKIPYAQEKKDQDQNVHKALNASLRVLIYNGDTDLACNFLMGQQFCYNLGMPLLHGKKAWKVGKQISGFATRYRNLDFVTVKGAGHMVPESKPKEALHMITSFLNNEPY